ncbi:MAG TPA: hypothetical protein VGD08_15715 [Stellaceae bacterium]
MRVVPVGVSLLLCAAATGGLAACTHGFAGSAAPQQTAEMQRCDGPANEGVDPWKLDQAIANAKPGTTKMADFVNLLGKAPSTQPIAMAGQEEAAPAVGGGGSNAARRSRSGRRARDDSAATSGRGAMSGSPTRLIYFAEHRDSAGPGAPSCGAAVAFDFQRNGVYQGWSVAPLADVR